MDLRYPVSVAMVLLLILLSGSIVFAESTETQSLTISEPGSEKITPNSSMVMDLIEFVNQAAVYTQRVGKEAALKEFKSQNGSFTQRDRYIWAYNFNGENLAHPWHPEYLGENKLSLTDNSGFKMIEAMQNTALNGSGFVTYQFENPVTGLIKPKLAYVKRIDDSWWIASGIYGENYALPAHAPDVLREALRTRVDQAIRVYTGCRKGRGSNHI